ncbi:MAG: hypothetical protein OK422_05770 [Thaumarchaeota archaeon]|nr:hypothetical protein [Nitrososphaerota archaeon]
MENIGKKLAKLAQAIKQREANYMVAGSGLVPVPKGRLNEISKVIAEYHEQEARKARVTASLRRV